MSFKIAMLVCLTIMCLVAFITYYFGKKVSQRYVKYVPVFSFGIGVFFFYIKLNFISYHPNSFDRMSDIIAIIILLVVCSIAFLEAFIIDIVENTESIGKGFKTIRKALKLVATNKEQV